MRRILITPIVVYMFIETVAISLFFYCSEMSLNEQLAVVSRIAFQGCVFFILSGRGGIRMCRSLDFSLSEHRALVNRIMEGVLVLFLGLGFSLEAVGS